MQTPKKRRFPQAHFLKKFLLYDGLPQYCDNNTEASIETQTMISADPMAFFHCKPEWPVCLYDFTIKSMCPNYFVFAVQPPLHNFLMEDYYYGSPKLILSQQKSDLLIQRGPHICQNPKFVTNFKLAFDQNEPKLLQNTLLNRVFSSELEQVECL